MTRRECVVAAITLVGCTPRAIPKEQLLPVAIAEVWQLQELRESAATSDQKGARRVISGVYKGPGTLKVEIYELVSRASGLDMVQKRRPTANSVAFDTDKFFAVVNWESTDREKVTAFVRALEKHLKE